MASEQELLAALERAEQALDAGRGLAGTGFWRAVAAARRDPAMAARHADRMGAIDRRAFEAGVRLRVPISVGIVGLCIATAVGVAAVVLAVRAGAAPLPHFAPLDRAPAIDAYGWPAFVPVAFLVGLGALVVGTHSLAHWLVGRAAGIRFTHVFLAGRPPEPGVKTDYASYLRTSPRMRAVMHASGAVVTKIVPFALLPAARALAVGWPWLTWILISVGVVLIITDAAFSTKTSDWKKVLREWRAARG